jgi:hypothetical protein
VSAVALHELCLPTNVGGTGFCNSSTIVQEQMNIDTLVGKDVFRHCDQI